jgi:hypothetical protein
LLNGLAVVLSVEKSIAWIYITFLLPDNSLIEISELLQRIDEAFEIV